MDAKSTDLVVLNELTPSIIFAPGGVDQILERIEREVRSFVPDISTESGRKAIASLAYKVARSKTALDDMGKDLVADLKKQTGAIDGERRTIRDRLDALKDEVRKPLTDWENAEKQRLADHEAAIARIAALAVFDEPEPNVETVRARLAEYNALPCRDWQEFAGRAERAADETGQKLNHALALADKRETERAELERLRREQAERDRKEHEARIAAEAAERARVEAEAKAKREADQAAARAEAERKRIEQEKADAVARAEKAEADRRAAAEKAERDAREAAEAAERDRQAAIEAERKRAADEQERLAVETAKREADKKHRAKINNEALSALLSVGVGEDLGKAIIAAVAKSEIPHMKMVY